MTFLRACGASFTYPENAGTATEVVVAIQAAVAVVAEAQQARDWSIFVKIINMPNTNSFSKNFFMALYVLMCALSYT